MTIKRDSITVRADGSAAAYIGPAAVDVFRIKTLISALGLLAKGITPTRGLTSTKALAMATQYTGKAYKRGHHEQARIDLGHLIPTRLAALDVVKE